MPQKECVDVYCVQDDSEDSETDGEEDEDTSQTSTNTQPASYYHRYTCTPQSTLKHPHCLEKICMNDTNALHYII